MARRKRSYGALNIPPNAKKPLTFLAVGVLGYIAYKVFKPGTAMAMPAMTAGGSPALTVQNLVSGAMRIPLSRVPLKRVDLARAREPWGPSSFKMIPAPPEWKNGVLMNADGTLVRDETGEPVVPTTADTLVQWTASGALG